MRKKPVDEKMLDLLEAKEVRHSREGRRWSKNAIRKLVAQYRKYRQITIGLKAELSIHRQIEAACRRNPTSTEVGQLIALLDEYRKDTLLVKPDVIGPRERRRIVDDAISRHAKGDELPLIAREHGVNVETLRTWIEKRKAGRDKYQRGEAKRKLR